MAGSQKQRVDPAPMDTKTVLILFLSVVILVIYLVCLLLIVIRRARKLIELHNRRYYIVIIFYVATKLILCAVLVIQFVAGIPNWDNIDADSTELIVKNGIVLADFSVIELFLISLEHYFRLCLSTLKDSMSVKESKMISMALRGFQGIVCLLLLIPLIILDLGHLNYDVLNGIGLGLNVLVLIFFLVAFFFFNFKMTGVLVEERINEVIKRVYKVQLIILVSRAFMITFEMLIAIYVKGSFQETINQLAKSLEYEVTLAICFIIAIVFMLFTEGLPAMYSLRSTVVQSLNYKPEPLQKQSIFTSYSQDLEESLIENKINDSTDQTPPNELRLRNFKHLSDLDSEKGDQSIWILKKGTLDKKEYVIRISKHEISSFIFQDIQNEISLWSQLAVPSLSKLSYFYEGQILHLVQKYHSPHLDEAVSNTYGESQLLKIAIRVGEAIVLLHQKDIVHGCLSPFHIFVEAERVILNGCGLHSFRKYLSLITGYTNKSMYTAVEHLRDKNSVILKPQKTADVYSFGIILYEIITKNRQYRQLTLKEVISKFADQNFRPKLPEQIRSQIKNLIRRCWHESPERRPEMEEVIDQLRRLV